MRHAHHVSCYMAMMYESKSLVLLVTGVLAGGGKMRSHIVIWRLSVGSVDVQTTSTNFLHAKQLLSFQPQEVCADASIPKQKHLFCFVFEDFVDELL